MFLMVGTTMIVSFLAFLIDLNKQTYNASDLLTPRFRYNPWLIGLVIAVLVFVAGFRYGFVDTPVYRYMFEKAPEELLQLFQTGWNMEQEFGFIFFMSILHFFSDNSQILLLVCALITIVAFFVPIIRYSVNIPFSICLFLLTNYLDVMNEVRQMLVSALFMLLIPQLIQKRFVPYVIAVLLLSTVHVSALLCLPLYFVLSSDNYSPAFWILLIGAALTVFLPNVVFNLLTSVLGEDSKYGSYLDGTGTGMSVVRLAIQLLPIVLLLMFEYRNRDTIGEYRKNRTYTVFVNLLWVNTIFYCVATRLLILARLTSYFQLSIVVLLPFFIQELFGEDEQALINYLVLLFYFFFFCGELWNYQQGNYLQALRLIF